MPADAPIFKKSSPRKRGCFQLARDMVTLDQVFPAQAGVFLAETRRSVDGYSLPRASGGISR